MKRGEIGKASRAFTVQAKLCRANRNSGASKPSPSENATLNLDSIDVNNQICGSLARLGLADAVLKHACLRGA